MLKQTKTKMRRGRRAAHSSLPNGFTLVEMLVAVTLILVMMTLFAEVFQIASSSMSKTRGISENDQRSRTLQTIIKADLDKRTSRWVYPFAANEDPGAPESNIGKRQGFLYYSENNPFNDLDDVLHFTVMSTMTIRNKDTSPYYGQALYIPSLSGANFGYNNQPDADDAQLNPNNTGLSTVAEVIYFVRNGNLYRRQLLIREPLSIVGDNPQPADNKGANIFYPAGNADVKYPFSGATAFWNDYDYSAVMKSSKNNGATFLGTDYLSNNGTASNSIAYPPNRYGFSPDLNGAIIAGRPKEFLSNKSTDMSDDLSTFIGRFTLAECSSSGFGYPQFAPGGNIPTDPSLSLVTADDFGQGLRRGEDLMLANVHAFDVQIWDEGAGSFVNICDPTLANTADYSRNNRLSSFGPRLIAPSSETQTVVNAVYDTWHPKILASQMGIDTPPFRPVYRTASSTLGGSGPYSDEWQPNYPYKLGDIVFPSGPPGSTFASPPYALNTFKKLPFGTPFFYRCIYVAPNGTSGGTNDNTPTSTDYRFEPNWPRADGLTVNDGSVIWQAVENRKPLRALRIQIRFLLEPDPNTNPDPGT